MKPIDINEALYTKLPLRFNKDGKFRILMVSDIHGGIGYSLKTPLALNAVLQGTHPDLVLLGGDIAGPGAIHVENEQHLRDMLNSLCEPLEKAGIPWAHVYGNHDNNFGLSNQEQQLIYESYPHCISKTGPKDVSGSGNYVLPVWDNTGKRILFSVFGLDSHRGLKQFYQQYHLPADTAAVLPQHNNTGGSEDTIHFSQIMWYWQTSEMLEEYNGEKIPAMMYMHIPLPELALIAKNRSECAFEGYQGEDVSHSELNSGLFSTLLQRGDVKAVFCGHDHENDFSGIYCGIHMGYDGFLSYHACQQESIRGGRIIDLYASDPEKMDTYMVRVRDFL